jgi:hypothetical protein
MHRRGGAAYVTSIAAVGVAAVGGCSTLLGLRRAEGDGCVLQSDCQGQLQCIGGVCSSSCVSDQDCPSNLSCTSSQTCEPVDAAVSSDVSNEAAAEAEGTAVASNDGSTVCEPACASFDLCEDSICHLRTTLGCSQGCASEPGPAGDELMLYTSTQLQCFQLPPISECGYLTGVGLYVSRTANAEIRLGIYEDIGGSPATLRGQTNMDPLDGFGGDFEIYPPVLVGCAPNAAQLYWICLLASTDIVVKTETSSAGSVNWATGTQDLSDAQAKLQSGLVCNDPTSGTSKGPVPLIYAWFVPVDRPLGTSSAIQCEN